MSFQLQYRCASCGSIAWADQRPAEYDCPCYIPEAKEYENSGIEETMGKIERKARYRYQYALNQYTWKSEAPQMFMGAFEEYPDRNKPHVDENGYEYLIP